jgi:hypothetical protein
MGPRFPQFKINHTFAGMSFLLEGIFLAKAKETEWALPARCRANLKQQPAIATPQPEEGAPETSSHHLLRCPSGFFLPGPGVRLLSPGNTVHSYLFACGLIHKANSVHCILLSFFVL